jgi:hypothetical protein
MILTLPKRDLIIQWLAVDLTLVMLLAMTPVVAAERTDRNQVDTAGDRAAASDRSADQASSMFAEVERQLKAAQAAIEAAAAEVARRDAAKRAADQEANRAIALATEKLHSGSQDAGTGVTEAEAAKLRGEVARAIQSSDEAGRALSEAQAALDAAEKAAVNETAPLVEEVTAARIAAGEEVEWLSAEAGRLTEEVEAAVSKVAEAEAARAAAAANVERLKRIALEAVERAAQARHALANAQASETAVEDELTRVTAEVEGLAEEAGLGP